MAKTITIGTRLLINSKYPCIYCGKVNNKRIIYNTLYNNYKLVPDHWIHGYDVKVQPHRTDEDISVGKLLKQNYIKQYWRRIP